MQNNYNLTVVLPGGMTPAKKKSVRGSLEKLIPDLKGEIKKTEEIGEKDLAYVIKKTNKGYFLNFRINLDSVNVKSLLSKLQLDDTLLRYLLVKVEGKEKTNGKKSK